MSVAGPRPERGAFFWMGVLRWGAATAVVIEHVRDLLFLTSAEARIASPLWKAFYFITGFGHEAVMVFFVLSGFWITSSVDRRIDDPGFWSRYLTDRLSRLLIVVGPALLLGGALDLASQALHSAYTSGQSGALTLGQDIAPRLTPQVLLGNLLFLQTILVPTFGSNGPLWSLANEFWYYLWFPALLIATTRRRLSPALVTLGIAVVSPALIEGFAVWLMGSALYYLDKRRQPGPVRPTGIPPRAILAASALILAAVMAASRMQLLGAAADLAVGLAFAAFIRALLIAGPAPLKLARPLERFGAGSSFSLYAIHLPVVVLIATVLPPGGRGMPDAARLAAFVGITALVTALAWAFSMGTEARTGHVRSRLLAWFNTAPRPGKTA